MVNHFSIKRLLLALVIAYSLISSAYVMVPFAIGATGSGYTGLDSYPYGTPSRPMVYRVLMPMVMKAALHLVPDAVERPVKAQLISWRDSDEGKAFVKKYFLRKPPLDDGQIFESAAVLCVCYVTLLMFLGMLYMLARAMFPESTSYALLAPFVALQVLPILTVNNGYIYDFSELFFSCLLTWLMLKGRYCVYLIAFAIATLNKETTLFMIVFFAAYVFRKVPFRQYRNLMLAQCVLYVAIKGALMLYFASYPGELIGPKVTVAGNLHYLWQWGDYKFLLFALALMAYRWTQKPAVLRAGLPMLLVHWGIYFAICVPGEYRDLYWSLPAMLLLMTHSLVSGVDIAKHPLFSPVK